MGLAKPIVLGCCGVGSGGAFGAGCGFGRDVFLLRGVRRGSALTARSDAAEVFSRAADDIVSNNRPCGENLLLTESGVEYGLGWRNSASVVRCDAW